MSKGKKSEGKCVDLAFHVRNSKRPALQHFPLEQVGNESVAQPILSEPQGWGLRLERWGLSISRATGVKALLTTVLTTWYWTFTSN